MITFADYLPIDDVLLTLNQTLDTSCSVLLHAPPGAGKTTRVPLALLDSKWLANEQRILMLEPRRLAARAAAQRMAWTFGESVGQTVGYRIRHDTKISAATRIEVVTEGVLTRILQNDPELSGYGCIIFDEFHERSIHADTGLALCLESQEALRDDLRLVVMSATLDCKDVSQLMNDAPIITSEGQSYAVDTRYIPNPSQTIGGAGSQTSGRAASKTVGYVSLEEHTANVIRHALKEDAGSILVFLPGAGEIHRVREALNPAPDNTLAEGTQLHLLYGNLPRKEQDAAIAPTPKGARKVVLSTAIAETSLTIEGIRIVIDAGRSRSAKFSPASGMSRLVTEPVSRAAATQRKGRAGRLESGVCYRLWSEAEHASLRLFSKPEITEADLAPLALELARWGTLDATTLRWLTPPPEGTLQQARMLLQQLGALDRNLCITRHGSGMANLPLHPRLAHMLLKAKTMHTGHKAHSSAKTEEVTLAATLAALLEERDFAKNITCDIRVRLGLLEDHHIPKATAMRIRQTVQQICRVVEEDENNKLTKPAQKKTVNSTAETQCKTNSRATACGPLAPNHHHTLCGRLLAQAYPDRIAHRQQTPKTKQMTTHVIYRLTNGKSAYLPVEDPLSKEEFLVAATLDGKQERARIWLAAPLSSQDILTDFAAQLVFGSFTQWDSRTEAVLARTQTRLGALVLKDAPLKDTEVTPATEAQDGETGTQPVSLTEAMVAGVLEGIRSIGLHALPWNKETENLRNRMAFMHALQEKQTGSMDVQASVPMSGQTSAQTSAQMAAHSSGMHQDKSFPDVSDASLLGSLEIWLAPFLSGITRRSQFNNIDLHNALLSMLDWPAQQQLNSHAPTHMQVPSGSSYRIDYSNAAAPVLPVKLQEMFGAASTPTIANGTVPLTLHLLSPAGRPLQVTRDLVSFWANGYQHVRSEMRGRYPKHPWPEDPANAEPTRKTNRQLKR